MPDELDDQIRAAMKVLDEQTPAGYFDAVPNQILARLEDGSMMQSGTTDMRDKRDLLTGPPVAVQEPAAPQADRTDDSGLHDIRNLAQSTKQRLSSRRITQSPPIKDEDVLATSSGSWKNIALPQPAAMVSLPELEDLPSKQEVLAAQKAAAKSRKAKATGDVTPALKQDVLAPNATANAALASLTAAPVAAAPAVSESVPMRQAFSLPSMEQKKSKAPLFAVVGVGLAAAAGAVFFMQSSKTEKSAAPAQTAMAEKAPAAAPAPAVKAEPIEAAAAGSAAEPTPPPAEEAPKADDTVAAAAVADESKAAKHAGKAAPKKAAVDVDQKEETKVEVKPEPAKTDTKDKKDAKAGGGEGEPSFDALLKEAGVEEKKEAKPKLDKKSLSGDDFKHGMAAINGKAQGCYKGNQGTATVKLTIAPSGAVTKVTVGGQFAGTPEGACVEAAVKSATFPAWDGGPQSFNFSYMLSD